MNRCHTEARYEPKAFLHSGSEQVALSALHPAGGYCAMGGRLCSRTVLLGSTCDIGCTPLLLAAAIFISSGLEQTPLTNRPYYPCYPLSHIHHKIIKFTYLLAWMTLVDSGEQANASIRTIMGSSSRV